MEDLLKLKTEQVVALQRRVDILETWILELTSDSEIPPSYKKVIRNELLKTD